MSLPYDWSWVRCPQGHKYPETLKLCPACSGKMVFDDAKIAKGIVSLLESIPSMREGLTFKKFLRYLGGANGPRVSAEVLEHALKRLEQQGLIEKVPKRRPDPGKVSLGSFDAFGTSGSAYSFLAWRLKSRRTAGPDDTLK